MTWFAIFGWLLAALGWAARAGCNIHRNRLNDRLQRIENAIADNLDGTATDLYAAIARVRRELAR